MMADKDTPSQVFCPNHCEVVISTHFGVWGGKAYDLFTANGGTIPPNEKDQWNYCPHCGSKLVVVEGTWRFGRGYENGKRG